jgi:hypothetical protein
MKTNRTLAGWLMLLATLAGSINAQPPPVTLTVTPAVISNTYPGVITLNITGLTNTETVTVQRWLDLNGNGVIDPGEPLIDAFNLTDNILTNALIGGITNINVPFDTNPTNGAITTALNCAWGFDNLVGHCVFQVVSPGGRFSPVTAPFAVTNATLGQSVSGIIYSNGAPCPNALVWALDQGSGDLAGAAVADDSGHYFLTLAPGGYSLIPEMANCYGEMASAPLVNLTNGMAATNNLFLTNGTVTISGSVYDAGNSNGIGGLMVMLQSGGLMAGTYTDSNGNYSAAVPPAFWTIQPVEPRLTRRAYLFPEALFQVDATGGNVTNANIALPKGNALFYGRITDNSGAPFANVKFVAYTGSNFKANGFSDQNGYYAVAVLGDRTNDCGCKVYQAENSAIGSYIVNNFQDITNAPNQTTLENFVALPATGQISGRVQDNYGNAVIGAGLYASATINGINYNSLEGDTDNSGNYSLVVAAGQWSVQFFTGTSSDCLNLFGLEDITGPHNVNLPPTNAVVDITVYPIGTPFMTAPQRFGPMQFGFNLNGAANASYNVQVSTNLASTNWASLFSLRLTNNTSLPVVDYTATNSPRFYRAVKQ